MSDDPADLSKLHDIVTPPDVSWWPLAPGWLVLLAVLVIALGYSAIRSIQKWKKNAYRREALQQLDSADSATRIAEVLKRTALAVAPREKVAALNGSTWIDWLTDQSDIKPSDDIRSALTRSIYQAGESTEDLSSLRDFARNWVKEHQSPC